MPLIERHVCSQDGNRRDNWQQKRWTAFDKTTWVWQEGPLAGLSFVHVWHIVPVAGQLHTQRSVITYTPFKEESQHHGHLLSVLSLGISLVKCVTCANLTNLGVPRKDLSKHKSGASSKLLPTDFESSRYNNASGLRS